MSPELYNNVRRALLGCRAFESNESLYNLFAHPDLNPWRHSISASSNRSGRVDAAIAHLYERGDTHGRNALGLLLLALSQNEGGQQRRELQELALQVDPGLSIPEEQAEEEEDETPPALRPQTRDESERYVNFELSIGPGGHALAKSDAGQRSATITLDVPQQILEVVALVETGATNGEQLRQLGQHLYDWLFPGPISLHLNQTEAVARDQEAKVRLRLQIEPSAIARLPLEFLYHRESDTYFATNPNTVLSRYLNVPLPARRVRRREGPLHLLAIVSDPTDLERLDLDTWEEQLNRTLTPLLSDKSLTLKTVTDATRRNIRDALYEGKPDIVQFIGHGIYRWNQGQTGVALVDEDTKEMWKVNERQFCGLFKGFDDHLGLISLAACESGQSDDPQSFRGLAPRLQQQGIPAVLAMQYKVNMRTAMLFLEEFYTAVAARKPIDWATQVARNAVAVVYGDDNREFATPVLYMRAEDGHVFG